MSADTSSLIFGKYELLKRLAVGGMGEVFMARQVGLAGFERFVILKSLLPDLAGDPVFIDQFLDEARVAATLNHPNVVQVYEVGASGGVYYIAMEYIAGTNLSQVRRRAAAATRPIPPEVTARIVREAALGLHHAHHAVDVHQRPLHLVHRDVSPQNIMVRSDGVTKVVDFGIATASNRVTKTRTGTLKGKVSYMSPEQVMSKPLDGRSDQFALGVVLWELLTARPLFHAHDDASTMKNVLTAPIEPPSRLATTPPELDAVVLKMLARAPEERFATCDQVARALDGWLRRAVADVDSDVVTRFVTEVDARPGPEEMVTTPDDFVLKLRSGPTPTRTMNPGGGRRTRVVLAAITALALGGGAFAWWSSAELPPAPAPPQPSAAPAPPATLLLSSEPPGAAVTISGEAVGITPLILTWDAGTGPKLQLQLAGYRKTELVVSPNLESGERRQIFQTLDLLPDKKKKGKIERKPAWLTITSTPPSRVSLDGQFIGATTVFKQDTLSGPHEIDLEFDTGQSKRVSIELAPGELRKLNVTP